MKSAIADQGGERTCVDSHSGDSPELRVRVFRIVAQQAPEAWRPGKRRPAGAPSNQETSDDELKDEEDRNRPAKEEIVSARSRALSAADTKMARYHAQRATKNSPRGDRSGAQQNDGARPC